MFPDVSSSEVAPVILNCHEGDGRRLADLLKSAGRTAGGRNDGQDFQPVAVEIVGRDGDKLRLHFAKGEWEWGRFSCRSMMIQRGTLHD
ncbi:MAG: hypothetical protein KF774_21385 [Planctomyces sp.]|nr:hypothetical protein [Planctomyces sp.]